MRNHTTMFHSNCIILLSHQKCTKVLLYSTSCYHGHIRIHRQIVTILIGMKWYFIMVLVCIFLLISDAKKPFVYLLSTCSLSILFGGEQLKSFACFKGRLVEFCYWVLGIFYMFLVLIFYLVHNLQIFSPVLWADSSLLIVSFDAQMFLILKKSDLSVLFSFCCLCFGLFFLYFIFA